MIVTLTGVAETITAFGGTVVSIGTLVMQILAVRGRNKIGQKVDENTALTKATAVKMEEVHAQVASTSGTFPTIKDPSG